MADINIKFASATSITCTLASLTDGSARECTSVDNATNLYVDAMVRLHVKLATGTPSGEKSVYVWFYASADGTNFTDNATGSDAAVTMRSPTNLFGPFVIRTPDSGALTYKAVIPSVASFFGGILPVEWGFVVENQSGVTFDSTEGNHAKEYVGIEYTSA